MKKILVLIFCTIFCTTCMIASQTEVSSEAEANSESQEKVYYSGPAWRLAPGSLTSVDETVNVRWTDNGTTVNGESVSDPGSITGQGYLVYVGGRAKQCNHYVIYGGDRYLFP